MLSLVVVFAVGAAAPNASASPTTPLSGSPPPSDPHRALARETARLRTELELARGQGFYLKLDAHRNRLSLMLKGVPLQEHALEAFQVGTAQLLFWRRSAPPDWDLQACEGGRLEPERERDRIEIVAPAPSPAGDTAALEPAPPALPPTAEEAYSVPSLFRIVFEGGPSLEVTAEGGGRNRGLLQRAWDRVVLRTADVWSALRASGAGRVRLRLRLSAEDAAALYRSLPPDVRLLVVGLAPR